MLVLAGVAAWRWRAAGALAGAMAVVAASAALRDRPWVDRRTATLDLLWDWQPGRLAGPSGPPRLAALALPFELPRAPWRVGPGEWRNSRRMDVPAGRYVFQAAIRPATAAARVRVELGSGPLVFASAELDAARGTVALPVLLPAGGRRVGISMAGVAGEAELEVARLVPEALVPRDDRGRFSWPEFAEPDRYRFGDRVRVTVLDRSAREGDGFRVAGGQADVLVDGPADARAVMHVQRDRPAPTDEVEWAGRTIALGPALSVAIHAPVGEGLRLGPEAVVPVRVRAPGAWVRVREAAAESR